jgi:hypothetical protein
LELLDEQIPRIVDAYERAHDVERLARSEFCPPRQCLRCLGPSRRHTRCRVLRLWRPVLVGVVLGLCGLQRDDGLVRVDQRVLLAHEVVDDQPDGVRPRAHVLPDGRRDLVQDRAQGVQKPEAADGGDVVPEDGVRVRTGMKKPLSLTGRPK